MLWQLAAEPPSPADAAPPDGRQGAAEGAEQTASTEPADSRRRSCGDAARAAADPTHQELAAVAPPPPPTIPEVEPGAGSLAPVPVAELVEDSQYGPLPKVAADGRRPLDVYARPSRYAPKARPGRAPPRIAILVTGLGLPDSPPAGVLKGLPPSVSVAYGAYGRSLQDGVTFARADGHEVLLQIPLEPNNYPTENPGPHTLLTTLPPAENMKRLQWLMSRYTGYVGVTNLMGAKFEATQDALTPVLEEMKARGLLYVDDGSAQTSTAGPDRRHDRSRLFGGQRPDRRQRLTGRYRQAAGQARGDRQGAGRRHRGGEGEARHRQAARRMGGQAAEQGLRARAGQRRGALAAAKLILVS